jgi:hypothetical protein
MAPAGEGDPSGQAQGKVKRADLLARAGVGVRPAAGHRGALREPGLRLGAPEAAGKLSQVSQLNLAQANIRKQHGLIYLASKTLSCTLQRPGL